MANEKIRILCVDDDIKVLNGLKRQLYAHFEVFTAAGGEEGLKIIKEEGQFAVVISDMRMPKMDGATFLKNVLILDSDIVRILLTGQADINSTIRAVNEGHIFRFLTKPCSKEDLLSSLKAAGEQYRLITSERVLLEETLQGSIKTLTDILAIANPDAFSRATKIKRTAMKLLKELKVEERWPIKIAAHLSQIGSFTLPPEMIKKTFNDELLTDEEQKMVDGIPQVVDQLLSNIPRLESVRKILFYQSKGYDGTGFPIDDVKEDKIPVGARILKIVRDYVWLEAQERPREYIFKILSGQKELYDKNILDKFISIFIASKIEKIEEIRSNELQMGMILTEDVYSSSNILLVSKGNEITLMLLARIRNFAAHGGVKEPIKVIRNVKY